MKTALRRSRGSWRFGALLLALPACDTGYFVTPESLPASLAVSYSLTGVADETGLYALSDRIQIQLRSGEAIVLDETRDFDPELEETRIQLEVDPAELAGTVEVSVALAWGNDPVLRGVRQATIEAGQATEVAISLTPIIKQVRVEPEQIGLQIGESDTFTAVGLDALGDPVPASVGALWSISDPGVATIIAQTGTVTAVAAGEATVSATLEGITGTGRVEVATPGADIVVFNDVNVFDGPRLLNPGNRTLVRNLVNFPGSGQRSNGTVVWFDSGRGSPCTGLGCVDLAEMRSLINGAGLTITDIQSSVGSLTSIPMNVKVIFLWVPGAAFTLEEINTLKRFAQEGGRLVFVGERQPYYGSWFPVENQFLSDMGAGMQNIGGDHHCSLNVVEITSPASSLRTHQITDGVADVQFACSSAVQLAPGDYPLIYDLTNSVVLAAVAKIDTRPLTDEPPPLFLGVTGARYQQSQAAGPIEAELR